MLLEFQQSKSYEKLEVPQIQLIVGVQDSPVVSQRQVPTVLSLTLQVQFSEVVDLLVVLVRQVLGLWVQKTADSTQLQFIAVDDIPVVAQFLLVQTVLKTIVIPPVAVLRQGGRCPSRGRRHPCRDAKAHPHGLGCPENHRDSPVPR